VRRRPPSSSKACRTMHAGCESRQVLTLYKKKSCKREGESGGAFVCRCFRKRLYLELENEMSHTSWESLCDASHRPMMTS
jgi:hypothetical protein